MTVNVPSTPHLTQVQGVLAAAQLDRSLQATGVRLLAAGEGDYLIVMDEVGRELLDHLREYAVVTGSVSEVDGEWLLRVSEYHIRDFG